MLVSSEQLLQWVQCRDILKSLLVFVDIGSWWGWEWILRRLSGSRRVMHVLLLLHSWRIPECPGSVEFMLLGFHKIIILIINISSSWLLRISHISVYLCKFFLFCGPTKAIVSLDSTSALFEQVCSIPSFCEYLHSPPARLLCSFVNWCLKSRTLKLAPAPLLLLVSSSVLQYWSPWSSHRKSVRVLGFHTLLLKTTLIDLLWYSILYQAHREMSLPLRRMALFEASFQLPFACFEIPPSALTFRHTLRSLILIISLES